MNPTLFLKKDNVIIVIANWLYPLAPTTYYHHVDLLKVEIYEFDYISKDGSKAYYKYQSENKKNY